MSNQEAGSCPTAIPATKPIAMNSHLYRPIGLGYSNLGSLHIKEQVTIVEVQ